MAHSIRLSLAWLVLALSCSGEAFVSEADDGSGGRGNEAQGGETAQDGGGSELPLIAAGGAASGSVGGAPSGGVEAAELGGSATGGRAVVLSFPTGCVDGMCGQCPAGYWVCPNGLCTDIWNDWRNCGTCGAVCPPFQLCSVGRCG